MEKKRPHFALNEIKRLLADGAFMITRSARLSAFNDFGLVDDAEIAGIVDRLASRDFYKSMTTLRDSRLWQDVYRPTVNGIPAYLKVQIVNANTIVISLKRL